MAIIRYSPVFVTVFCFTSFFCFSNGDSLRIKYPITDYRNSDCACHKYQAIADKEYFRIQHAIVSTSENENLDEHIVSGQSKITTNLKTKRKRKPLSGYKKRTTKVKRRQFKEKGIARCFRW